MTRSRRRKLSRSGRHTLRSIVRSGVPVASALLAAMPAPHAAAGRRRHTTAPAEVVVTAEKVQENLQNVPISVEVFDNKKLDAA